MTAPASPRSLPTPYLGPRFNWVNPILILVGLGILGWSVNGTNFSLTLPFEEHNVKSVARFVGGLFPPETDPDFLRNVGKLMLETIQISVVGTFLAIVLGFPLGVLALRQRGEEVSRGSVGILPWLARWTVYYASRLLLNLFRAIPE